MKRAPTRRIVIVGLFLVVLIFVAGVLFWLHAGYHAATRVEDHVIICGSNVTLGSQAGLLAGCPAMPCTEILPSGDLVNWHFVYC